MNGIDILLLSSVLLGKLSCRPTKTCGNSMHSPMAVALKAGQCSTHRCKKHSGMARETWQGAWGLQIPQILIQSISCVSIPSQVTAKLNPVIFIYLCISMKKINHAKTGALLYKSCTSTLFKTLHFGPHFHQLWANKDGIKVSLPLQL